MIKRIGMLTSGGDCQALNATMRGVVKGLSNNLDELEVYGFDDGYKGLIYGKYRMLTSKDFSGILTQGGTILGTSRQPFKLMRVPDENGLDKVEAMKQTYYKLCLDCLVILGGNGTQKTANLLREEGLNIIHLPKTIDNDLAVTDHTPGYGSAAKYIASTMKEIIRDALVQPIKIVNIIEIMGRNAGWLTAAAALAKGDDCEGADLIYLPETVFDINKFVAKVQEIQKTKKQIVVAVSEGVKTADGKYVCESASSNMLVDSFGHKQLSGTATALANVISNEIGCKTRAIEFSTIQRCASHIASLTDVNEAFIVGGIAVKAAFDGETGKVGIFQRLSNKPYLMGTSIYDVNAIANVEKTVPQEWIINDGTGVSQEALDYMRPLIQGEIYPYMVDGLPRHIKL